MVFSPAQRLSLRQIARGEIRHRILTGELKPGERLLETAIARQMSISRAPVREAIRQLEQEGLVRQDPHHSPVVASLSASDVRESYELRAWVEARAIRKAVHNVTEQDLTELGAMIPQMVGLAKQGNLAGMVEVDVAFHRKICSLANCRPLLAMWQSLSPHTWTHMTIVKLSRRDPVEFAQRHEPIVTALASRNPDVAEEAITRHISELESEVLPAVIDAQSGGDEDGRASYSATQVRGNGTGQ